MRKLNFFKSLVLTFVLFFCVSGLQAQLMEDRIAQGNDQFTVEQVVKKGQLNEYKVFNAKLSQEFINVLNNAGDYISIPKAAFVSQMQVDMGSRMLTIESQVSEETLLTILTQLQVIASDQQGTRSPAATD